MNTWPARVLLDFVKVDRHQILLEIENNSRVCTVHSFSETGLIGGPHWLLRT